MKLSVNDGGLLNTLNTLLCLTSNGNIGIGGGTLGQTDPLTIMHATTQDTTIDCALLLQSSYAKNGSGYSVFDERGDIYFAGINSITETSNIEDVRVSVMSAISGSKDVNYNSLNGRLDLLTNNDTTTNKNGLQSRASITYDGKVGINIMQPASTFNVAPELTMGNGDVTKITTTASSGTIIEFDNYLFSALSTNDKKQMFVGGSIVVENDELSRATIISVNADNQITVDADLSSYIDAIIHIHYAGLNVSSPTAAIGDGGCVGVNTTTPGSVLSVNGSLSLPIIATSVNIVLDLSNYTIICNTSSGSITVSLPTNTMSICGRIYVIKKSSVSNVCTVDTLGSALIDNAATQTITNFTTIQSDGTNWWRISYG